MHSMCTYNKPTIMKKLFYFVTLIAAFACVGCTDVTTDNDMGVDVGADYIILSAEVSAASSKTELGEKDTSYPLFWSEGDCISINGTASQPAIINAENPRRASFKVQSDPLPTYPYDVLYPAGTNITFPTEQNYREGTFDVNAMPMYGYVENAASGSVKLQHLAGVLRFNFVGKTALMSMTVTAESGNIGGVHEIDCKTGALTPTENVTKTINYSFGEGLQLSTTAVPFYITLPAGEYGICTVMLTDNTDKTMTLRFNTTGEKPSIKAGRVKEFSTLPFIEEGSITLTPLEPEEGDIFIPIPSDQELVDGALEALGYEKDDFTVPGQAHGYVRYSDGTPAAGIPVSDGFQVVITDENGFYTIQNQKNWF